MRDRDNLNQVEIDSMEKVDYSKRLESGLAGPCVIFLAIDTTTNDAMIGHYFPIKGGNRYFDYNLDKLAKQYINKENLTIYIRGSDIVGCWKESYESQITRSKEERECILQKFKQIGFEENLNVRWAKETTTTNIIYDEKERIYQVITKSFPSGEVHYETLDINLDNKIILEEENFKMSQTPTSTIDSIAS
ncbi:MAG: hypothetical protein ABIC91_00135 [Nanoarchaeota archaeon]|nr:hypothetical protein [Nanoarchaeota archaeon]MBU1029621.1 hypothetical protein [Nanoarchaeota archaeon]MBU1850226.1 hypothetical protein [Nanoarchaeota archaeon]